MWAFSHMNSSCILRQSVFLSETLFTAYLHGGGSSTSSPRFTVNRLSLETSQLKCCCCVTTHLGCCCRRCVLPAKHILRSGPAEGSLTQRKSIQHWFLSWIWGLPCLLSQRNKCSEFAAVQLIFKRVNIQLRLYPGTPLCRRPCISSFISIIYRAESTFSMLRVSWIKPPLNSADPHQVWIQLKQRKQRSSVTLTDERMFTAAGRGKRWESPWWRCIWSFRIHATPPCLTWLIKREGTRLAILGLSHPCVAAVVPGEHGWLGLHLCWLLIEAICAQFYHCYFISTGNGFSWQSADVMTTTTNTS